MQFQVDVRRIEVLWSELEGCVHCFTFTRSPFYIKEMVEVGRIAVLECSVEVVVMV